ncbi:hypothetical protein HMPREF9372_1996 [Sporosarcina newyorkensis 2681]|uniref:DUF58 domain-containing protein n=1 Tax=Sporosarcina newyorkensis 2681 TaxID=1027292 RepID=F9DT65_9BACL|nr:DUF58 domain-containing protein [Sporosarcina newyorkensis]EGQ25981.1 hypothetical protein HMPREF9372_1996 [Sporosarcina newyorkensis 2681]
MKQLIKRLKSIGSIVGVVGIGVASYIFAKFQGGFVSWFIFYMLLPFVLYSILLYFYPLRDFTVKRKISAEQLTRGGRVIVRLIIERKLPMPLLYTVIIDKREHANKERTVQQIVLWGFRRRYEYSYTLTNIQRGEYRLKAVEIEVVDFFNWIRKRRVYALQDSFLVYPKMTDVLYESANSRTSEGQKMSAYMLAKDATIPSSVREYAAGDRMSWIHWKSFARTNKLMTKEFDEQHSEQYTVLLDSSSSETFEDTVELAASILTAARNYQAMLTLMISGDRPAVFPAIQSGDQMQQALVHLAKIQSDGTGSVSMPLQKMDASSKLLVITGNLRMEFIHSVLQFCPNPASVVCFVTQNDESENLQVIIEQVRRLGITVQIISKTNVSSALKEAVTS